MTAENTCKCPPGGCAVCSNRDVPELAQAEAVRHANAREAQQAKPWTIEENPSGFVYVVDHDGKKICTVYGSADQRLQRAMAIAELPVLVDILKRRQG